MWLCFALATLAKGPQVPAMFLMVFAWFLARERVGWREAGRILRPLSGLLLMLAITVPWWWLLRQHLGGQILADSQLSGKLLSPSWSSLLNPYYLYRTPQLALPWLILFPVAVVMTAKWATRDRHLLLLLGLILLPAVLLSLGPQRRWYYMLPVLAPICLLLAVSLQRLFAQRTLGSPLRRWLDWALPGQWILALVLLFGAAVSTQDADLRARLLSALATVTVLGAGFRWCGRHASGTLVPVAASATLFLTVIGFVYPAGQYLFLAGKEERMAVARFLASEVPTGIPLATLGTGNETYVFYARRRVLGIESASKVRTVLDNAESARLILILRRNTLESLPDTKREILFQSGSSAKDPLLVVLLES